MNPYNPYGYPPMQPPYTTTPIMYTQPTVTFQQPIVYPTVQPMMVPQPIQPVVYPSAYPVYTGPPMAQTLHYNAQPGMGYPTTSISGNRFKRNFKVKHEQRHFF
ncbi:hypothetical protein DLAC_11741 [Tieghemostelium lacteum]|uniref:Uncharacterized protein n=1 Tax=Tieghemostelium lacteum TaxID=361077 RepID=A0A151Z8H8_TIELA|nr:hypothetical protein DLAC_11741 [Tieghemostelium lacteum]|eukprot:KYQ90104.1 hypothetical protein DLAC_11741 [Tieghemostelium lacteum]